MRTTRRANEARVLEQLRVYGGASRAELKELTGLSRATLSVISRDLLSSGRVIELAGEQHTVAPSGKQSPGRQPVRLALNPNAGLVLGVDFSHRQVSIVVANAAHQVLMSESHNYAKESSWSKRAAAAVALVQGAAAKHGVALGTISGIGVGVPGAIAQRPSAMALIGAEFTTMLDVPIRMGNNAQLAGLAESLWGAAKDHRNVAYLKISNGVGGVLIFDGRIYQGATGTAGEFGHMCLDPNGPSCRCGNQGCLESYVGLDRVLRSAGVSSVAELCEAVERLDPRAEAAVAEAGSKIGVALSTIVNALDIQNIVLGGDLARLGARLLLPVKQSLSRHSLPGKFEGVKVATATLGDLSGALGGLALILQDQSLNLSTLS